MRSPAFQKLETCYLYRWTVMRNVLVGDEDLSVLHDRSFPARSHHSIHSIDSGMRRGKIRNRDEGSARRRMSV